MFSNSSPKGPNSRTAVLHRYLFLTKRFPKNTSFLCLACRTQFFYLRPTRRNQDRSLPLPIEQTRNQTLIYCGVFYPLSMSQIIVYRLEKCKDQFPGGRNAGAAETEPALDISVDKVNLSLPRTRITCDHLSTDHRPECNKRRNIFFRNVCCWMASLSPSFSLGKPAKLCINCAWHDPLRPLEARYGPTSKRQDPLGTV
jgi:hypothetical protein